MEIPLRRLVAATTISIGSMALCEHAEALMPAEAPPVTQPEATDESENLPINLTDTQLNVLAVTAIAVVGGIVYISDRRGKRQEAAAIAARKAQAQEQREPQSTSDEVQNSDISCDTK